MKRQRDYRAVEEPLSEGEVSDSEPDETVLRFEVFPAPKKKPLFVILDKAMAGEDYRPLVRAYQSKLEGRFKHLSNMLFYCALDRAFEQYQNFQGYEKRISTVIYALFPATPNFTKVRLEFVTALFVRAFQGKQYQILNTLSYYFVHCKNFTADKIDLVYPSITQDLIHKIPLFCARFIAGGLFNNEKFPMDILYCWLPMLPASKYGTTTYEAVLEYLFQDDILDEEMLSFVLNLIRLDAQAVDKIDKEFLLKLSKNIDLNDEITSNGRRIGMYFTLLKLCKVPFVVGDVSKKYTFFKKLSDTERQYIADILQPDNVPPLKSVKIEKNVKMEIDD